MPRGDGTGPDGKGPRNGRGQGRCGAEKNLEPKRGRGGKRSQGEGQGLKRRNQNRS